MKILFVVPPWTGHVNPTVSVARALEEEGHEVAWCAHEAHARPLLPAGARVFDLGDVGLSEADAAAMHEVRFLESLRFLWQSLLVPLARATRGTIERVLREWQPDVVAVDHQAIGGALAVRRAGVRWATLCTTSASVVDTLSGLPQVKAWVDDQVRALEREAELEPAGDLSPSLAIVFSTRALIGDLALPPQVRLVGPSIAARRDDTPFPWDALRPGPRVFVSIGTVSLARDRRFFDVVAEAVAGAPWQTIVVAPDGWISDGEILTRPRVPQLALLPQVSAVVCHAGHNTVCESLANGLPLVVAPIRDDQPVIADQVVRAGAGVRVHFGRLSADKLRAAIERALAEPGLRAAAGTIKASFAASGGAREAARLLVNLG